jgi:hypothetical protein
MIALSSSSLSRPAAAIRVPGYDRLRLHPGIVHIGVGSFHVPPGGLRAAAPPLGECAWAISGHGDPSAVLATTIHGGWFDDLDAPVEPYDAPLPLVAGLDAVRGRRLRAWARLHLPGGGVGVEAKGLLVALPEEVAARARELYGPMA